MAKNKKNNHVCFIGASSEEVTGSANLVQFQDYNVLVDYGLYQSNDDIKDYEVNSKRDKRLKPKNLDGIILTHNHIDHSGRMPMLYKNGADCPIFIPKDTKGLLTLMLQDSVKIFQSNLERFSRQPLYSQIDVDNLLRHVVEVDYHKKIVINDSIYFEYYNANHITKSCQVLLTLDNGINKKNIGFTGDICNKDRYYLNKFESLPRVDLLVGECTYSNNKRLNKTKDRKKDIEKLKLIIQQAKENNGKVLIPIFANNRIEEVLTTLYLAYKNEKCPMQILVTTPLGTEIANIFSNLVEKNDILWDKVFNWDNVCYIDKFKNMLKASQIKEPCIILGTGGVSMSGGTSVFWIKNLLSNKNNHIVFCGYSSETSLAGRIKEGKEKEVNVDGQKIKNKASITSLNSFSSHMDYKQLLDYYKSIPFEKLCLVHSNQESKVEFAKELKKELSKLNRTSKVIVTNKSTEVSF